MNSVLAVLVKIGKLVSQVSKVSKVRKVPMEPTDSGGRGGGHILGLSYKKKLLARFSIEYLHYFDEESLQLR